MENTFLEIIDTRSGNARKTGIGASWPTVAETREMFESAKPFEVREGPFLLDLIVAGDLVDTIFLDAEGVKSVSGIEPRPAEEYVLFDELTWAEAANAAELQAAGLQAGRLKTAKRLSAQAGYVSVSYLQRNMRIGYVTAAKLLERLIAEGFCADSEKDGMRRYWICNSEIMAESRS